MFICEASLICHAFKTMIAKHSPRVSDRLLSTPVSAVDTLWKWASARGVPVARCFGGLLRDEAEQLHRFE